MILHEVRSEDRARALREVDTRDILVAPLMLEVRGRLHVHNDVALACTVFEHKVYRRKLRHLCSANAGSKRISDAN